MYRYRPDYKIKARHFKDFPHNSSEQVCWYYDDVIK